MKENLTLLDRMLRVLLSAVVVYLFYTGIIYGYLAVVLLLAAAFIAVTAFTGYCPIYRMLRISSLNKKRTK